MSATQADVNRALGRVEGDISAMKDGIDEIKDLVRDIDRRLAVLEKKESERKGAMGVLMFVAGIIGGLATKFAGLLLSLTPH